MLRTDRLIYDRFSGGADRDRTGGLLVANQALSQLSYSPPCSFWFQAPVPRKTLETRNSNSKPDFLVGLDRLELSTSPLSGVRSSHLSYRPGWFKIPRPFPEPKIESSHQLPAVSSQ